MIQSSRIMSRQVSFTAKQSSNGEKGVEAEHAMGRHIEQREYAEQAQLILVLLRLDFSGVFTAWLTEEKVTRADILAEGGL